MLMTQTKFNPIRFDGQVLNLLVTKPSVRDFLVPDTGEATRTEECYEYCYYEERFLLYHEGFNPFLIRISIASLLRISISHCSNFNIIELYTKVEVVSSFFSFVLDLACFWCILIIQRKHSTKPKYYNIGVVK